MSRRGINMGQSKIPYSTGNFTKCSRYYLPAGISLCFIYKQLFYQISSLHYQEVDHFKFLQTILSTQNYEGVFFPKPDSPCLYIEENNGPDGCAIFFKRDKFQLKNSNTRVLEVWRVQSNQVAIAVNLQIKATGHELCICTTHLKARHGSLLSKLRNEQGRDLMRFVKQFAGERAVIICGDFNAEPIEPVYATVLNCEFLKLASAYSDIRAESEQCNSESELKKGVQIAANGDMVVENNSKSSNGSCRPSSTNDVNENCDKVQRSIQNEPPYTTWKIREHGEECHTIDYVFYTKELLKVNYPVCIKRMQFIIFFSKSKNFQKIFSKVGKLYSQNLHHKSFYVKV